ncbi:hypothetical protein [Altericroceibacterium xinjiangense]|uniref:hypothetical protein n=1 Tax=Altericroceibacterium xinjiangense TaxID=762261 RepID=UPI000F7F7527|nr:hypothetical protein [Altericroceibacterium xinjiangense]
MSPGLALMASVALIPAMAGPLQAQSHALTLALCGGGVIPLDQPVPGSGNAPCCAKGCHTSSSRKRFDRTQ